MGNPSLRSVPEGISRPCDVSRSPALPRAASQRKDALNARLQHLHRENEQEKTSLSPPAPDLPHPPSPTVTPGCLHHRSRDRKEEEIPTTYKKNHIGFSFFFFCTIITASSTFPFFLRLISPLCPSAVCLVSLFIVPLLAVAEERHHPALPDMSTLFSPVAAE